MVAGQARGKLGVELNVVAAGRVGFRPAERRSATLAQHEFGGCAEQHLLKVAAALDEVAVTRGYRKEIIVAKGTGFFSKAMDAWAYHLVAPRLFT